MAKKPVLTAKEAAAMIPDGATIMCGGFLVYNEKQRLWVRRRYVKQKVGISRNHGTWGDIFAGRMWRKKRAAHEWTGHGGDGRS